MSIYAVAQRGLLKLCGTPLQGGSGCPEERLPKVCATAERASRID